MSLIEEAIARMRGERQFSTSPVAGSITRPSTAPAFHKSALTDAPVEPIDMNTLARLDLDFDRLEKNRVINQGGISPGVSAYKMLRTRVIQRMRANGWRRLAISSLAAGEGKTLTALNLCISIARDRNFQSVLTELDLRRLSICKYLGVDVEAGIESYLQGNRSLQSSVYATSMAGLYLAPAGQEQENSSELLASTRAHSLVASLSAIGDATFCVFDLPPLLQADDLLVFAPLVDAVLLVVAEGQTNRQDLVRARELLADLNLLGVVLNRSMEPIEAYGY